MILLNTGPHYQLLSRLENYYEIEDVGDIENVEDIEDVGDIEDVEDIDSDDVVDIEDVGDYFAWQRAGRPPPPMNHPWELEVAAMGRGPPFHTMVEGVRRFRILSTILHSVDRDVGDNERVENVGNCIWNVFQRLNVLYSKESIQGSLQLASEVNVRQIVALDEHARLLANALDIEDFIAQYWEALSREDILNRK